MAEKGAGAIEKDRDYAFADYIACKRWWWWWCCITTVICMFTRWIADIKSFNQHERSTCSHRYGLNVDLSKGWDKIRSWFTWQLYLFTWKIDLFSSMICFKIIALFIHFFPVFFLSLFFLNSCIYLFVSLLVVAGSQRILTPITQHIFIHSQECSN